MQEVRVALEEAISSRSTSSWNEVDRLAFSAVRNGFNTPDKLRELIKIALARTGYNPEEENYKYGTWIECLLDTLLQSIERNRRACAEFFELPFNLHSLNSDRTILAVTSGWLHLLQYPDREKVIGRSIMEFLTPDSQEKANLVWPQFWEDGVATGLDYTFIRGDGRLIRITLDGLGIRDEHGDLVRSISTLRRALSTP